MPWPEPKFRITRSRGYDSAQVDALIDRLDEAEQTGQPIGVDLVRNAQFAATLGSGYRMDDVDAWLDQVIIALAGSSGPTPSAPAPSAPAPSAPATSAPAPAPYVATPDTTTDLTSAMTSEVSSGEKPRWPVLTGIAVAVVVIILIFYFAF